MPALVLNHTLHDWLQSNADKYGADAAITASDSILSHRDVFERATNLSAGLRSLGLKHGDVVGVQLPNIPEFIISYLAISSIGGIMQTLHMPYRHTELEYLLKDSNASAVICLSSFRDSSPAVMMLDIATSNKMNFPVISLGEPVETSHSFEELITSEFPVTLTKAPVAEDLFVLLYTSGTTSSPKGVPHRYNSFLSNAQLCCQTYGFTNEDRLLSLAPMSHLYGLFTLNMALSCGANTILLPAFNPEGFINTVRELRPTAIFAAPAHFALSRQQGLLKQEDFSSVKFVCLSGSAVMPELAREVDELLINGRVGQLWGMSELQAGAITRLNDDEQTRFNSAGKPTPGTEIRIADGDKELPANKEGELQVKGISVFDAYHNKPEESQKAFTKDKWFRSGDLAVINDEGHLTITGRTKSLINRGGIKFNPVEIEALISKLPEVVQCAIIPQADEILGEKASLFIVTGEGDSISLDEICRALEESEVAKYKWPEELHIIDAMPMTPTNKVKLDELVLYLEDLKSS